MMLQFLKRSLPYLAALAVMSTYGASLSATACIFKDVNNTLTCRNTNIYDCNTNLKGKPVYEKTCEELENGGSAAPNRPDYMRDHNYRSCLNRCSSSCSGYKTPGGADSCVSSCQSGCTR